MSNENKYDRILRGNSAVYSRKLSKFKGVDLASEPSSVDACRMPYARNMWRDYESEDGGAIESITGYRRLFSVTDKCIYGIFAFRGSDGEEYLAVHAGSELYRIPIKKLEDEELDISAYIVGNGVMAEARSSAFGGVGCCYILDGKNYFVLYSEGKVSKVESLAYVPVTYHNGKPLEQRNMLTDKFINRYTELGEPRSGSGNSDYGWRYKKVILTNGSKYLKITGIACEPSKMKYAYIPYRVMLEGETNYLSIKGYEDGAFDELTETVQLVCDAPLNFTQYTLGKMTSLTRVVLRHRGSSFAFNACESLTENMIAKCDVPLTELWLASRTVVYYDMVHEYSDYKVGIASAAEKVTLYAANPDEIWLTSSKEAWSPTKTDTVYGVIFSEERTGSVRSFDGVQMVEYENPEGVETVKYIDFSAASGECKIYFSENFAYTHTRVTLRYATHDQTYCFLLRDPATATTNDEHGKSMVYKVRDPFDEKEAITAVTVNGEAREFYADPEKNEVEAILFPDDLGEELCIYGIGSGSEFSSIEGLASIYEKGLSAEYLKKDVIAHCRICCVFDGHVFLTGAAELPNTVFFSGIKANGTSDPCYFGIYDHFDDGIGNVCNTAMVANAALLEVFKGELSSDGTAYYHSSVANMNAESKTIKPYLYTATEGVSNIPCLGAACNFADDTVFVSSYGVEGIEKRAVNLEKTICHRSRRIDPLLKMRLDENTVMAEWKGYLCVFCSDGTVFMADSRAVSESESTGEDQYEWFVLDGIGTWKNDTRRVVFSDSSYIEARNVNTGETERCDFASSYMYVDVGAGVFNEHPELDYMTVPVLLGCGEADETAEVYSFSQFYADGNCYELDVGEELNCILVKGSSGSYSLCPVTFGDERIGGEFYPAYTATEYKDKLYFGTASGDVCVFNTDKRGVETQGEAVEASEIHSYWYDRCGHRYTSGFATLSDNCDEMNFKKSTLARSCTVKAKKLKNSAFTLCVKGEASEWDEADSFTVSENGFGQTDMGAFSFTSRARELLISREKLKGWCEKQYYLYSDGFRRPFGIFGLTYNYVFNGRSR